MTQVNLTSMQVTGPIESGRRRKWFFDFVPNPLPQPGDFIDTKLGRYYEVENNEATPKEDKQGNLLRVSTRIFVLSEHNNKCWIVQLVCE